MITTNDWELYAANDQWFFIHYDDVKEVLYVPESASSFETWFRSKKRR